MRKAFLWLLLLLIAGLFPACGSSWKKEWRKNFKVESFSFRIYEPDERVRFLNDPVFVDSLLFSRLQDRYMIVDTVATDKDITLIVIWQK